MGRGPHGMGRSLMTERPDKPVKPGTFRRVASYFKPYRWQVAVVLVLILLIAVFGLINPILIKLVIDIIIRRGSLDTLTFYVALMVAAPIVTGLIGVGQTYLNTLIGQRVMRDLRNYLYEH